MLLTEGTKLKTVKWQSPYLRLNVNQDKIESLTVSMEAGTPWVITKFEGGAKTLRPLTGNVMVVLV